MQCPNCQAEIPAQEMEQLTAPYKQQVETLAKANRTKTILLIVLGAIALMLLVLTIVFAVRGKSTSALPADGTIKITFGDDEETTAGAQLPYEPRTDVTVQAAYVSGTDAHIIVQNDSKDTLIDYKVAYVAFDAAGNAVNNYNKLVREQSVTTANLLPGTCSKLGDEVYLGSDSGVKYIEATLTSAKFKGGEVWQADGVDAWAEKAAASFTVEAYNKSVEAMKSDALKAESNPYLQISDAAKSHSNPYSPNHDLDMNMQNTGEKTIKSFVVLLTEYDAKNYPTAHSGTSYFLSNCRRAYCDPANIEAGDSDSIHWKLVFSGTCETFKYIVSEIEFADGTTWQNPYAAPWLIYNEQKR